MQTAATSVKISLLAFRQLHLSDILFFREAFYSNRSELLVSVFRAEEKRSKRPFPRSPSSSKSLASSGEDKSEVDVLFFFSINSRSPNGLPSPVNFCLAKMFQFDLAAL